MKINEGLSNLEPIVIANDPDESGEVINIFHISLPNGYGSKYMHEYNDPGFVDTVTCCAIYLYLYLYLFIIVSPI